MPMCYLASTLSDWLATPIEVIPAVDVLGEGAVRLIIVATTT